MTIRVIMCLQGNVIERKQSGKFKTAVVSNELSNLLVTGKIGPAILEGEFLKLNTLSSITDEVAWGGEKCVPLHLDDFKLTFRQLRS